jgi:hypothetical protein
MPGKPYKFLLVLIAAVLLAGASQVQRALNRDRDVLGLNRYTELKGAPPVLTLTTVALGGFRGLISNALWIRANDLQDNDKFFEMVQLADWITKLEPHFTQVWLVQAWNMAYNISVKFKDPYDRWRWVQRGIELLRDDGLRYNPHELLMYRELAWFFQHKMGANLDDAHMVYKQEWANEMSKIFGMERPNWSELINPTTDDARQRAKLLREKYKMDPVLMKKLDETYGPLEWRLPEAHAIYWAALGMEEAAKNEKKIKEDDIITLRRVIYQSMQLSFQRGRLVANKIDKRFEFGPNLDIIPKVSAAYEQAAVEDPKNRDHIETAHRNMIRDAVFFLYSYNREADAAQWFKYLGTKFPGKPLLDGQPNSLPGQISLDDFAIGRIQEEVNSPGRDKVMAILEGLERTALKSLAVGETDRYTALEGMAGKIWLRYQEKIKGDAEKRVAIPPMAEIKQTVLNHVLEDEVSPELGNELRNILNLPPSTNAPPSVTNSPAATETKAGK